MRHVTRLGWNERNRLGLNPTVENRRRVNSEIENIQDEI